MSKKKSTNKKRQAKQQVRQKKTSGNAGKRLLPALIIAALGFLLYANTLGHSYTLDDFSAIKENFVTKQGFEGIPTIFKTSYRYGYWKSNGTLYRPLSLVMFATEWQLAEDNASLSHFMNVLLYVLTGFFLFLTLRRILKGYTVLLPFLAALFFIAHPTHVEVVANIKSRDEILAFLFCILAVYWLWDYLKSKQMKHLIFALVTYTVAMFSKENAITFLAIIPLMIYCFTKVDLSRNLTTSSWFIIPVGLYFATRQAVLGSVQAGLSGTSALDNLLMAEGSGIEKIATAFVLLGKYLIVLIFPYNLVSDIGYNQVPMVGLGNAQALMAMAVLVGLTIWALMNISKKSIWAFGILYAVITFSLFSNLIVKIGSSYGERFLYMASLGFAMILAWAVLKLTKVDLRDDRKDFLAVFSSYKTTLGVVALIFCLYAARTITRNPAWYNSYTLYQADINTSPNSAKLNYHYGLEQVKQGLDEKNDAVKQQWFAKGMASFQKAIEIYPKYHDAYSQLGLAYYRQNQPEKALENYNLSLQYKENNANVYSNMGIIYFNSGQLEKAQEVYEKAVKIDERFVDARRNLGSVYARKKEFDKAIHQFKEGLKYEPNNATLYLYLGYVHRDKGDNANAQTYLNKAYQLDPSLKK